MKILVVSAMDSTNLSFENVIKEMIQQGHEVEIFATVMDEKDIRMFKHMGLIINPAEKLTSKIVKEFDVAFCGPDSMNVLCYFDIYIFSYNFLSNNWPSDGADFMFTAYKDRILRCKEDCAYMPIGIAKNDTPKTKIEVKNQILYIDAGHIPFGEKGKYQVANMLLEICENFPSYNLVVKPRWLLKDTKNQTHKNGQHLYVILETITNGNLPDNLILLNEHIDLQELIDSSFSIVSTSISCYIDAILRGKGIIIAGEFDCEDQREMRKNVALKRDYDNAKDAGCYVDYREVVKYLPEGIHCDQAHLERRVSYTIEISKKIVYVMDYIYTNFLKANYYPVISKYEYENYKEEMVADNNLTMQDLKYKRQKNRIIGMSRIFDFIDAQIDYTSYFELLESLYKNYDLNFEGFKKLKIILDDKFRKVLVENAELLMSDPINQSFLFSALSGLRREDEIILIPQNQILCEGPYYFYLGRFYRKQGLTENAIEQFIKFLKEANGRSYIKYSQEREWGLKDAYNYLFRIYDGNNIGPFDMAELYIDLFRKGNELNVEYGLRKKLHNFLPKIAEELESVDFEKAYQCLMVYAKQDKHYNLEPRDKRIKALINETKILKEQGRIRNRIRNKISKSFRLIRRGFQCIRDHGLKYTCHYTYNRISKKIKEKKEKIHKKLLSYSPIRILDVFSHKVLEGYRLYAIMIKQYGENARLFLSAFGTGDAYLYALFFEGYAKKYENSIPVFGVWNSSSKKVAELFNIQNIAIFSTEEMRFILNLFMFDSKNLIHINCMHYHIFYRHTGILSYLEGLHDFNWFSLSQAILEVNEKEITKPVFEEDIDFLQKVFEENQLIPSKTVLLAPYAKTVKGVPMSFWNQLAARLMEQGICVCTNSSGAKEPPVKNTKALFIPYEKSVPFLEKAGAVIGLRSGFLDIISMADCIKISLNIEKNYRRSLICHISESFSLSAMYGQKNQYDWMYSNETEKVLLEDIVQLIVSQMQMKEGTIR